jgi:hypothetical protein
LIQKGDKPVGSFFPKDFDPRRVMIVIQESDFFTDERNRGFIETAVESHRSVSLHLPKGPFSEEIFQMGRRRS